MRRARHAAAALLALALPAAAALAQALPGQDRTKPIEIVADTLVVDQAQDVATFSGEVRAVQGDMTLSSDRLRVFYSQAEGGQGAGGQAIRRIEAEGNVKLASARDTAAGDRGVYDVAGSKVRLEGNVVLTRGDSVIRGDSLEMDLASNVSVVRGRADAASRSEQRVRAVFVPEGGG
jgi:lipopolysaccharide export system protein LptA